jgi:alanyl-tRNA synthetase
MQQHTGQHLLSAAFERLYQVRTESFRMGAECSTIDLAREVTAHEIVHAEDDANQVVFEGRQVSTRFVSPEEAARLPLRKEPVKAGRLRLIDIDGYDLSACGGTHVARTGAVGLVAITGQERFKGGTRVEFVCGRRALARFHELRAAVAGAVRHLSVTVPELPQALERLQSDLKEHRQRLAAARERLAEHDARALAGRGQRVGELMVVCEALEGADVQSLKTMAQALGSQPGQVAILLGADSPHLAVVSRGPGAAVDAAAVLKGLTTRFGGRGGGRPELAQGGGLVGETAEILAAARASIEAART